jgi:DNA-directed RNA polymerase subunit RPC12/RpoP
MNAPLLPGRIEHWPLARLNPASADEEGDPVTLAEARTTTFAHRRKVFMVSTPTIRGLSRIEREFEASDQRRYFVPCPHCSHMQWLQFERLRWAKGQPETAMYHCAGCEKPIAEHHKTEMLGRGEWRATAISANPNAIGFHLSALYSPIGWKSWEQIARDWLAAQGSDEMLRAARNTLLGETWTESGEAQEWQQLAELREAYGAAMKVIGNTSRQEKGLWLNNRAENSHLPFRRRERAVLRFRHMRSLQKFAVVYASIHNRFNTERHLYSHPNFKLNRTADLVERRGLCAAQGTASLSLQRLVRIYLTPPSNWFIRETTARTVQEFGPRISA